MSSISVRKVDISFNDVAVLEQFDLEVQRGEFLVLLGPSGCGKSTLLNAIAGLLDVNRGQIWIDDHNVTWRDPKDRGIAMVFQSYALYPQMTVAQNMGFALKVAGRPREEVNSRVSQAATMLGLTPLLKRKPAALSGGQRQRVAIGRALVREVGVFLFDEPLSNLDAQLRNELRLEIKRLHQRLGATMVYVTHDQIEALTLADRIAVMKDRIIQQLATPEQIYLKPANRFVAGFVGSPAMSFSRGTVVSTANGAVFKRGSFQLPLRGCAVNFGADIELGVRPEHIVIGDGPEAMTATVDMVEPMGAETLVWTRIAGEIFSTRVERAIQLRSGDSVRLCIPRENVHLFDGLTGLRL